MIVHVHCRQMGLNFFSAKIKCKTVNRQEIAGNYKQIDLHWLFCGEFSFSGLRKCQCRRVSYLPSQHTEKKNRELILWYKQFSNIDVHFNWKIFVRFQYNFLFSVNVYLALNWGLSNCVIVLMLMNINISMQMCNVTLASGGCSTTCILMSDENERVRLIDTCTLNWLYFLLLLSAITCWGQNNCVNNQWQRMHQKYCQLLNNGAFNTQKADRKSV